MKFEAGGQLEYNKAEQIIAFIQRHILWYNCTENETEGGGVRFFWMASVNKSYGDLYYENDSRKVLLKGS